MSYRTLSHLFNDMPVANNPKSIAAFVRDLLPENIVADCRAVCQRTPNASAWLRIQKHAEACGVRAFILIEYRSEGGSWHTMAAANVKEALDDRRALCRRGFWGVNTAAVVFVAGNDWKGGGRTRIMVCNGGTIDLSTDSRAWHVVGHDRLEFLDYLDEELALAVTEE